MHPHVCSALCLVALVLGAALAVWISKRYGAKVAQVEQVVVGEVKKL